MSNNVFLKWEDLKKKISNNNNDNFKKNSNFWRLRLSKDPEKNQTGAKIRLLPSKDGYPYILVKEYFVVFYDKLSNTKKFFGMESIFTLGNNKYKDPIYEIYKEILSNSKMGPKELKDIINFTMKKTYLLNIYIENDLQDEENNGKVKLYKMPKTLFERILNFIEPSEDQIKLGIKPIDLYNPMNDKSLMITLTRKDVSGVYDAKVVDSKPLVKNEKEAEKFINENTFELEEWLKPEHYVDFNKGLRLFKDFIVNTSVEGIILKYSSLLKNIDKEEIPAENKEKAKAIDNEINNIIMKEKEESDKKDVEIDEIDKLLEDI